MNEVESRATVCTALTARGRSAIAVVGVEGPAALNVVRNNFAAATPGDFIRGQIRFGRWRSTDEAVVVTPLGPDKVEVHCHGGVAAVDRIMADLRQQGCRVAEADFDHPDPCIAGAMRVASMCRTTRTAAIAMDQVRGAFRKWIDGPRSQPSPADLIRWSRWTIRLTRPFDVAIVGPPNVGKSSLINALVGYERSIAMDMPGTTRDVLSAETVLDGIPIRFLDTAGIRDSDHEIESEGVERAIAAAASADLVIAVRDASVDASVLGRFVGHDSPPKIGVLNKSDLGGEPIGDEVLTSTLAATGLEALQQKIVAALVPEVPPPGSPVVLTEDQLLLVRDGVDSTLR